MADPTARRAHLCIDVQTMFATDTDWHAPWLDRTLPAIEALERFQEKWTPLFRFGNATNKDLE